MQYYRWCFSLLVFISVVSSISVFADDQPTQLELVANFESNIPPGNIAIGPDGRIFLSVHEFYSKPLRIVELLKDGSTRPYPNEDWAYEAQSRTSGGLYGVLGLNVDDNGVLWLLDVSGKDRAGRLIGWDTTKEMLHKIIYLAKPIIEDHSFLNDFAIDTKHNAIYVADTGVGSIIVVDLQTGQARRVLDTTPATKAENIDIIIEGKQVQLAGEPARLGINPITIDHNYEFVYFGPMSGTSIYRIATRHLLDNSLTNNLLSKHIERFGDKPISDGITIDNNGNVYITSITDSSIGVTNPKGKYQTLFKQDDLPWPDGMAVGLDNYIYVTINELHRSPVLNGGKDASQGQFKVVRFKSLAPSSTGR